MCVSAFKVYFVLSQFIAVLNQVSCFLRDQASSSYCRGPNHPIPICPSKAEDLFMGILDFSMALYMKAHLVLRRRCKSGAAEDVMMPIDVDDWASQISLLVLSWTDSKAVGPVWWDASPETPFVADCRDAFAKALHRQDKGWGSGGGSDSVSFCYSTWHLHICMACGCWCWIRGAWRFWSW